VNLQRAICGQYLSSIFVGEESATFSFVAAYLAVGGAIYCNGCELNVYRSTFSNNFAHIDEELFVSTFYNAEGTSAKTTR